MINRTHTYVDIVTHSFVCISSEDTITMIML